MAAIVFLPHQTGMSLFLSLEILRNHSQCQILMGSGDSVAATTLCTEELLGTT